MKVLQKKIMILVISSILISALLVIVIAFMNYVHIVRKDSSQIMQLMCLDKRQVIDEKLLNVEQSVNSLYYFAKNQINEKGNLWQDEAQLSEHMNRMEELMETTAQFTDGAVSVYYRLTPKMEEITQGIWLVKGEDGEFLNHDITNISQYDKDDIEHVGWYYIPIMNRKETWMNPYYNGNMDEEIISFVIPVIIDEEITGVVGMDVSTSLLYDNTKTVTVYDEGYAFLMDNEGRFVYHPEMKGNFITDEFDDKHSYLYEKSLLATEKKSVVNYRWNNADKKMTAQKLRNGMIFTWQGVMNLRNKKWEDDFTELDPCGTSWVDHAYSRAYVRHLIHAGEMLGLQILSIHNLAFYLDLVTQARQHILAGDFKAWKDETVRRITTRL